MASEETQSLAKEIELAISSREGTILKQINPIAKTLSYPIKKRASGFFGVLEFQLEPEKLLEIKDIVGKDKKIIRHMFVVKDPPRIRRIRRQKEGLQKPEQQVEEPINEIVKEEPASAKSFGVAKEKVELKDIEQKLDEILGE